MARKLARNEETSSSNGEIRCRKETNTASEKKEPLTRRSFVRTGILVPLLALVGAADAREQNRGEHDVTDHLLRTSKDLSQGSATAVPERTITLQGTETLSAYEFTVEGTLSTSQSSVLIPHRNRKRPPLMAKKAGEYCSDHTMIGGCCRDSD